jgi:hypothetical protein
MCSLLRELIDPTVTYQTETSLVLPAAANGVSIDSIEQAS